MQVNHLSNSFRKGKQSGIDGFGPFNGTHIDNQIDQGIQIGNGTSVANARTLDAQLFGLAVDTFAGSALGVNDMVKRAGTIKQDALESSRLPVRIFLTALVAVTREMGTRLAGGGGENEGTAEPLGAIATGVLIKEEGNHAQALLTERRAVRIAVRIGMAMLVSRNGSNATLEGSGLVDVPCIIRRISSDMGRKVCECERGMMMEGLKEGDIMAIEGLGEFGKHDVAVVRSGSSSDSRAIAPEIFFLLLRGAIGLLLIGATLDAQFAVRVARVLAGGIEAFFKSNARIVLLHPGIKVLDIKGNDVAEAGDLFL